MEAIRPAFAARQGKLLEYVGKRRRFGIFARVKAMLRVQLRLIRRRHRMTATRYALESLDDRMLKDIGLRRMELHTTVSSLYDQRVQGLPRPAWREPG